MTDNTEDMIRKARVQVAPYADEVTSPEAHRLDVILSTANLLPTVEALVAHGWGYLATITGLDLGVEAGEIELLYHLCEGNTILTLRVHVPRDTACVPSVCKTYPSASLFERELIEMLGVEVTGTPNTDRLFLPDDWPIGVYPLRKDFRAEEAQQ